MTRKDPELQYAITSDSLVVAFSDSFALGVRQECPRELGILRSGPQNDFARDTRNYLATHLAGNPVRAEQSACKLSFVRMFKAVQLDAITQVDVLER
jgi:hypothetical protein